MVIDKPPSRDREAIIFNTHTKTYKSAVLDGSAVIHLAVIAILGNWQMMETQARLSQLVARPCLITVAGSASLQHDSSY